MTRAEYALDAGMSKTALTVAAILVFLVVAFLVSPIVHVSVYAEAAVDTGDAIVFLKEVVGVDVAKYEVTVISSDVQDYANNDNPIGNICYIKTSGKYQLTYWDVVTERYSVLEVMFSFANATLRLCSLRVYSGEPYYSKAVTF